MNSYYYLDEHRQRLGPRTLEELEELAKRKAINDTTPVAAAGWPKWRTWAEVRPPPNELEPDLPPTPELPKNEKQEHAAKHDATCPSCGQTFPTNGGRPGEVIPCPACGTPFTVPGQGSHEKPSIKFSCPFCEQPIEAPAHGAGLETECPACGKTLVIPDEAEKASQMDLIVRALREGLSLRKIGFFLLGVFLTQLVCGFVFWMGSKIQNRDARNLVTALDVVLLIGLMGVVVGGVARMARLGASLERSGWWEAIRKTTAFCQRRFGALFGSAVLLVFAWLVVIGMTNGLVMMLNASSSVGRTLGGVLLLPQLVVNGALILVLLSAALVPCAVAVEEAGGVRAIRRLSASITGRSRALFVQTGLAFFGFSVIVTLFMIVFQGSILTALTNAPGVATLWGNLMSKSENPFSGMESAGEGAGDDIRIASLVLFGLVALSYPTVYWICSFTYFYESLLPWFRKRDTREATSLDAETTAE